MKMKVEAVKYPEFNDNKAAGQKYSAREKTICIRGKNKNKIASLISMKKGQLRKQLDGVGAKLLSENLNESIMDSIIFWWSKVLWVWRKLQSQTK